MPLIEVEIVANRFSELVQLLASAGPIPVGTLNGLGPTRLISGVTWGSVEVGPTPDDFAVVPGTLTARATLTLNHVSTAELDADQHTMGPAASATGWLLISANATELRVDVIGIDLIGAMPQSFPKPICIARRQVGQVAAVGAVSGAAILLRDGVVTLRFATSPSDILLGTPLNLLNVGAGDEWAIRLSGEVLAQQLLDRLTAGVTPPPSGTIIEDAPTASWTWDDGTWLAAGSVGLEKPDACPGLFGDVDISVTVNVVMQFTPNVAATPPVLNFQVRVSSDVSDWDSFRCWLGSGGIASVFLGAITGPIVGVAAGIVTLIAVGETVRLYADKEVTGTPLGGSLTLVSSDSTSATYAGSAPLPSLASSGIGTVNGATVNEFGLLVTGQILFLPAQHAVIFNPNEGSLPSKLTQAFSCNSRAWKHGVDVQGIQISDRAKVFTVDLGLVPVTVFPSTVTTPAALWSVKSLAPTVAQSVQIIGSSSVKAGDSGRIYLHTSAGIRRYEVPELAGLPPLTSEDQIKALASCLRNTKEFFPWETIKWLVDPPPFEYGYPAFRQWLVVFAAIPVGTQVIVHPYRDEMPYGDPVSFVAAESEEVTFEFVTDRATELVVEHTNREGIVKGRVHQRWLLPTQIIAVGGAPTMLRRSGKTVSVAMKNSFVSLDIESGVISRHAKEIVELVGPDLEVRVLQSGSVRTHEPSNAARASTTLHPFSLTLPGGKIAAAYGDNLLIAIPWGTEEPGAQASA